MSDTKKATNSAWLEIEKSSVFIGYVKIKSVENSEFLKVI